MAGSEVLDRPSRRDARLKERGRSRTRSALRLPRPRARPAVALHTPPILK